MFLVHGCSETKLQLSSVRHGTLFTLLPDFESLLFELENMFVANGAYLLLYRGADKSLARPISRCILFDGEKISFDVSFVIYINSTNIPPIVIINRIYENQNLLSP